MLFYRELDKHEIPRSALNPYLPQAKILMYCTKTLKYLECSISEPKH